MPILWKNKRKTRKTQAAPNPNVQNTINNLSISPLSQASQVSLQQHNLIQDTDQVHPQAQIHDDQPLHDLHHYNLIPSSPSVGQDQNFLKVCSFLRDDNVGIVGIYGMGGVGKTTLLERVHNEFLVTCNFDVIIWIVVSEEVNEGRIQKNIMKKLRLPYDQDVTQLDHAVQIYNELRMMNFVLIIDDIWETLEIKTIGIPDPTQANKSKIVFTTRSAEVCAQMHPHQQVKVDSLEGDDAWILSKQHVGEKPLESHPRIRGLAEQLARECRGLPLALIVIGRAMASKCTPREWEHALATHRKSPSEIPGTEKSLFSCLKLSYDALPNSTIRTCFLYCCLFPEDWLINKEKLVDYWIGEGFLGIDENLIEARNRGHHYISTLQAAFLLENSTGGALHVKMHDVIRDMGLWIVSEDGKQKSKFFVHPGLGLTNSQTTARWRDAHRIFTLDAKELPIYPQCSKLLTLIINNESSDLHGLFTSMPVLKVLDLCHNLCQEFPKSIEQLFELRYLSIRGPITLPSWLGNLAKLEILDLSQSAISLPSTIGQLVQLRHLNLQNTRLATLPAEVGNLANLEVLNLYNTNLEKLPTTIGKLAELIYLDLSETRIKMLPEEFWELKNLKHLPFVGSNTMRFTAVELCKLADLQSLDNLAIIVKGLSGLGRLSNFLTKLWIENCSSTSPIELLPLFGKMNRLSELCIKECRLEKIESGTESTSFSCLVMLSVLACSNLSAIEVCELSNLQTLEIKGCYRLKYVTGLQLLQQLEKLTLEGGDIEELIGTDEKGTGGYICFPRLKGLRIGSLPKLKSICSDSVSFPSLKNFYLFDCPRLEKLPLGLRNENSNFYLVNCPRLEKLPLSLRNENRTLRDCEIVDSEEWWQEDNLKSFLQLHFMWL